MTRIVTTHYRYKPPLGKRKAVAITGPAIVRKRGRADVAVPPPDETEPATPPAADDDAPAKPAPAAAKPAIAISISRKRTKLLRTEQAAEPEPDDPEADAAMHPSSRSCVGRSLDQPTFGRIEAGVAALLQEHGIAPRQFAPSDDPGHHEGQDKQHGDDDERPAAHSVPSAPLRALEPCDALPTPRSLTHGCDVSAWCRACQHTSNSKLGVG
jgi:hypothetical protein